MQLLTFLGVTAPIFLINRVDYLQGLHYDYGFESILDLVHPSILCWIWAVYVATHKDLPRLEGWETALRIRSIPGVEPYIHLAGYFHVVISDLWDSGTPKSFVKML